MTASKKKTCDVFISHAMPDLSVARKVADSLESAGLTAFRADAALQGSRDFTDLIWEALAESRAVIVIVSPEVSPHAMGMVEIGAAEAWAKPIFVLLNGPSSTKVPASLSQYPVYPVGRLEDVIRAIRSAFEPLTERDRTVLAGIYHDLRTPADQLSQSPKALRDLTTRFNRMARKQLSGERLLSEILRLRKRGQLPRLQLPKVKPSPMLKRDRLRVPKVKPSPLLKRAR